MSAPSTNIRVFVHWTEQTVFAGEDIECEITFKNIAVTPAASSPSRALLHPTGNGFASGGDKHRKPPTTQIRSPSNLNPQPPPPSRGHRSTLSLNVPTGRRSGPGSGSWNGGFPKASVDGNTHQRSLSIISIGASESAIDQSSNGTDGTRRLSRGHGRSASLQIVPRRPGLNGGAPLSAPLGPRSSTHPSTHPSPLLNSSFPPSPGSETVLPRRPSRRPGASTAPNTPGIAGPPFTTRRSSPSFSKAQAWKFPTSVSPSKQDPVEHNKTEDAKNNGHQLLSPKSKETIPKITEHAAPVARILSAASITGTPRSSGEFYSLSNNSTETLASEYTSQTPARIPLNGASHSRRPSNLVPANHHRPPETLMMGYAQIHGSFTLDASLISQTPFEEVKRKGAVGGQGGGVIGVETSKRDSGLLRSFGWGNIGESLGGFLGGGELSSIKDMRGIASSRDIPLLSTPQSLLFVDLRLAPGESKSYKYSFKLPKGLPPSHRGKAIKITYKLVIGTQRPGGAKEQQVKSVEIPFRVLGSVNSHGELLGHDLMAPYIILRDQARIHTLEKSSSFSSIESAKQPRHEKTQKESTLDDFLTYADELLAHPRKNSSLGLLSPTEVPRSRRQSFIEEPATAKEAIDMAILRSNVATESQQSANRFEIARSGRRVAVVMLARPAYRLGETVTVAVDFTDAEIPCYAVHAALETSESVDSGIALRSEASILRVTRKVHVSHSESALFARRIIFSPAIPITSTPEFITSGVSLDWKVRIEFVTPRLVADNGAAVGYADLLEEVSKDDRGAILAPAEAIECESFEISVPLRVYGALAGNTEQEERSSDGGLVV